MDCEVVRARSGNEALSHLLKREYAVVLLDVQMPGMDGFEVAKLAHANPSTRSIPIIFVTAMLQTSENLGRAYDTGAVDYLYKPIDAHVLRSKVRVFLDLYVNKRRLADEVEAHKRTLADLESFNYSVSHDLRAPLRHLDGFSRLLVEDFGESLPPDAQKHLERISAAARRMSQLIDDLLRLSQISRADVRLRRVDLGALARSVHEELASQDGQRDVELVVDLKGDVECDQELMRIAFENLLRNARKFTSKNASGRACIEISETGRGERVFFVKDDGVGFDPTMSKKMFRPFQRLHSAAQFEGTGIGLAIVARIIRHHGGRIWAESEPGAGATFLFTLEAPPTR
jgi:signal transduction histidine kinase